MTWTLIFQIAVIVFIVMVALVVLGAIILALGEVKARRPVLTVGERNALGHAAAVMTSTGEEYKAEQVEALLRRSKVEEP